MKKSTPTINHVFIPSIVALACEAEKKNKNTWLADYRQKNQRELEKSSFPSSHNEHFKYTRLHAFDENKFATLAESKSQSLVDLCITKKYHIDGLSEKGDSDQIVFINGFFSSAHSCIKKHKITTFSDTNTQQQTKILALLSQQKISHNPFTQVSACLNDNGIFIEIDDTSPDAIIEILHITDAEIEQSTITSKIVIDVAENCQGTVLSRFLNEDLTSTKTNLHTHQTLAHIGENATLVHYCLQLENNHSVCFAHTEYNLESQATLKAFYGATGSLLKKIDITVNHLGQHAHAFLNGLYAANGNQQIDYHTIINHPKPNGQTDEIFRGIVNHQAEATFNGRIHIFEDAQKTRAELSNKNLMLSDDVVIHTKPELEIYADDVICAHGATVSRMNKDFISYLQARGIAKPEAEIMLSYGFFNEVLAEIEHDSVADYLRPILFKRFD